jgi:hypothetical protein
VSLRGDDVWCHYILTGAGYSTLRLVESDTWETYSRPPGRHEGQPFGHSFIGDWVALVMVF